MTAGFALSCIAVLALVAVGVSVAVGITVVGSRRRLLTLNPADASRILVAASFAPLSIAVALGFAWLADPHLFGCHQHRCLHDHAAEWPSVPVQLLVAGWLGYLAHRLVRLAAAGARACKLRRALITNSELTSSGALLLPVEEPQAFVIGSARPLVCLSRGLVETCDSSEVEVVMAHERAHARRRDPLRRLFAGVGLAFHVPPVARVLERRLALAQEMAADADAAAVVGDRDTVAEVLVHLARQRASQPALAIGLIASSLEVRVSTLLVRGVVRERFGAAVFCGASAALAGFALLGAHRVHLVAETLLHFL